MTKKRKGQVQISELSVEGRCSPAVLDFLRSTVVGKTVHREDGEDERMRMRTRTGRTSRLGRMIRKMWGVLSVLHSALYSALRLCFTVWQITNVERRKRHRTGVGVRGARTTFFFLKKKGCADTRNACRHVSQEMRCRSLRAVRAFLILVKSSRI